jgi:hypothetical protein
MVTNNDSHISNHFYLTIGQVGEILILGGVKSSFWLGQSVPTAGLAGIAGCGRPSGAAAQGVVLCSGESGEWSLQGKSPSWFDDVPMIFPSI